MMLRIIELALAILKDQIRVLKQTINGTFAWFCLVTSHLEDLF